MSPEQNQLKQLEKRIAELEALLKEKDQEKVVRTESEFLLHAILNRLPIVLWITNKNLVFTSSLGHGLEQLGLQENEVVGMTLSEYLQTEDDDNPIIRAHQEALAGYSVYFEHVGFDRNYLCFVDPFLDHFDNIRGCIGMALDITERKSAEKALGEIEDRFKNLFELSPVGMAIVRVTDYQILKVNAAFCNLLGYSQKELLAMTIRDITHPEDQQMEEALARGKDFSKRQVDSYEKRYIGKKGQTIPVSLSMVPMGMEDSGSPLLLGVALDLTERIKREKEFREIEARILHKQKLDSLSVLSKRIAHDFNNLLMGVLGNAENLMAVVDWDPGDRQQLDDIKTCAMEMGQLAQQLLAYSGRGKFVTGSLNLNRLLKNQEQELLFLAGSDIRIQFNLSEKLPEFRGDGSQIQQLIYSLVANASESVEEGKGKILLQTGVRHRSEEDWRNSFPHCDSAKPGDYIFLEVQDDGCGMNKELLQRIFEPFFSTKFNGKGLGLSTTLGIVRGHNGCMEVQSSPGKGATFCIYFPVPGKKQINKSIDGLELDESHKMQFSGCRALLVDDDETVLAAAETMLKNLGLEVVKANSTQEALACIQEGESNFNIAILDLSLCEQDDMKTVDALRGFQPDLKILLSSGYDVERAIDDITDPRIAGILQKPYHSDILIETLLKLSI